MPIRRPGSPEPPAPADEAVMIESQGDPQKKEEEKVKVFKVQGKEEQEKEKQEKKKEEEKRNEKATGVPNP